jgi:hypothetical protein
MKNTSLNMRKDYLLNYAGHTNQQIKTKHLAFANYGSKLCKVLPCVHSSTQLTSEAKIQKFQLSALDSLSD